MQTVPIQGRSTGQTIAEHQMINKVHRKAYRNHPLSERAKATEPPQIQNTGACATHVRIYDGLNESAICSLHRGQAHRRSNWTD